MTLQTIAIALGISLLSFACNKDEGNPVSPPSTSNAPVITSVVPDSGFAGDTVTVTGRKFGALRGSSSVKFGNTAASVFIIWSDSSIRLQVPANAHTGNVVVTVGSAQSNGKAFKVLGTVSATVSFANDITPLFNAKGCAGCHGGNGGLNVLPYSSLMSGSSIHGPVVTPGDGEGSTIVKKLRGTAGFGARMPQGGPFLSETEIQKFVTWINEGALNN